MTDLKTKRQDDALSRVVWVTDGGTGTDTKALFPLPERFVVLICVDTVSHTLTIVRNTTQAVYIQFRCDGLQDKTCRAMVAPSRRECRPE